MNREPDDELIRQEREYERLERENRYRMIQGAGNFFGVLLGVVCILVLVLVLISLVNWLKNDLQSGFALFFS